jgi:sirohydrochlorin ferrochelatase
VRRRALILLDHGSRRAEADRPLRGVAEALRARLPDVTIHIAHLELVPPDLASVLALCAAEGIEHVAVHPFLLSEGLHLSRDVPERIARATAEHPGLTIELLEPLGRRPELADLVLRTYEASKLPRD